MAAVVLREQETITLDEGDKIITGTHILRYEHPGDRPGLLVFTDISGFGPATMALRWIEEIVGGIKGKTIQLIKR